MCFAEFVFLLLLHANSECVWWRRRRFILIWLQNFRIVLQVNGIDRSNYCVRTCRTQFLPSHNTHLHVSTAISIFSKYVNYFPLHQSVRIPCCRLPRFFARFAAMLRHPVVLKFSKTLLSTLVSSSRAAFPVWYNRVHPCLSVCPAPHSHFKLF